jgi:uncharacterized protein YxeA
MFKSILFIITLITSLFFFQENFDSNNYNVQYHDTVAEIESKTNDGSWLSKNGKVEFIPWSKIPSFSTYNKPGSFTYGTSTYVPSYKDSIYLSRTL